MSYETDATETDSQLVARLREQFDFAIANRHTGPMTIDVPIIGRLCTIAATTVEHERLPGYDFRVSRIEPAALDSLLTAAAEALR